MSKPKVGIVTGAFDILHPGYIRLFKDAKKVCDFLIVAVHEDPSLERPKEKYKPVFTFEERVEILMAIRYVDDVVRYQTENDLVSLLLSLKPDIRIVGSDYVDKTITGRNIIPLYFHVRKHAWSETRVRRLIKEDNR